MFRARIIGNESSLQIIHENFGNYILSDNNGEYYFTCPEFQNQDEENLFSFAKEKLEDMLLILNLKIDDPCNVDLGHVENIKKKRCKRYLLKTKIHSSKTNIYERIDQYQ